MSGNRCEIQQTRQIDKYLNIKNNMTQIKK